MSTLLLRLLGAGVLFAVWWPLASRPRPSPLPAIVVSVVLIALLVLHARWRKASALRVIREHAFPAFLRQKLLQAHPQLDEAAARRVERGLRQFFGASAQAQGRFVAMPSKVVDTLWHEFILHTRGYEAFCRKAFGHMLHHTPAEALAPVGGTRAMRNPTQHVGLRRAWYWACRDEGIDPRKPSRLPLLFALDASLGIAGGYVYALDCALLGADRGGTHCASDLSSGCGSGCGGDGGSSSSGDTGGSSSSSDGSSDGGGDGGGGGCGGGD
ncbi:MAG: hypothetical protein ABI781_05115 [Burkholderiales bacterium]